MVGGLNEPKYMQMLSAVSCYTAIDVSCYYYFSIWACFFLVVCWYPLWCHILSKTPSTIFWAIGGKRCGDKKGGKKGVIMGLGRYLYLIFGTEGNDLLSPWKPAWSWFCLSLRDCPMVAGITSGTCLKVSWPAMSQTSPFGLFTPLPTLSFS